ncbi:hypothetical protein TNIN_79401 [Trichonephila inaurata madagascariensis]|uniref:Uncharacterized protein n=1 Tax=Trichonephila inaurata madagascariensis TaxID=2747483 RepID=A0A8X6XHU5_9ARAC|nr:hypothetical protein TNIN_79401 [Trichonephila inaurata madagascariensis]
MCVQTWRRTETLRNTSRFNVAEKEPHTLSKKNEEKKEFQNKEVFVSSVVDSHAGSTLGALVAALPLPEGRVRSSCQSGARVAWELLLACMCSTFRRFCSCSWAQGERFRGDGTPLLFDPLQ